MSEVVGRQLAGLMAFGRAMGAFNPKPKPVVVPYLPPSQPVVDAWAARREIEATQRAAEGAAATARWRAREAQQQADYEIGKAQRKAAERESQIEGLMRAQRTGGR
jgi:hypothetical protein